jgi:putative inorganic carbon (HCO3(-)) transporter
MIDWGKVASNGIWLLGLAILLAGAGFADYARWGRGVPRRVAWQAFVSGTWSRTGTILFAVGMALTAASLIESALWGLLGLYSAWGWLLGRKSSSIDDFAVEQSTPAHTPTLDTEPSSGTPRVKPRHANWWKRLRRTADWVVRFELLWLVLISPCLLFPSPDRIWALLALPLLWIMRWVGRGYFVPRTPLNWPLVVLLCMVLVSVWATFDISQSVSHITTLLFGISLFYAILDWARRSARPALGPAAYALAGGAVVLVGVFATAWPGSTPFLSSLTVHLPAFLRGLSANPEGFNPNIIAGTLVLLAPFQLALLWWSLSNRSGPIAGRWVLGLGLAGLSAASLALLLLTRTRGALLGMAVGTAVMLLLGGRRSRIALLAGFIAASAGVGYLALDKSTNTQDLLAEVLGSKADPASAVNSLSDREEIWSRALYGIEDFPFTGMGINTFRRVMPILYPLLTQAPDADVGHAHNQFLTVALDLGLPGLVAYTAIWLAAVAMLVQAWRQRPGGWRRATLAGIGGALSASFVFGLTDALVLGAKGSFIFWALLGLLAPAWGHPQGEPSAEGSPHGAPEMEERQEPHTGESE